jgi:hypothetical protein
MELRSDLDSEDELIRLGQRLSGATARLIGYTKVWRRVSMSVVSETR